MALLGENDIIYGVRVWCDTHLQYYRTTQTNTIDPTWIPTECAAHPGSIRDFTIEWQKEVAPSA